MVGRSLRIPISSQRLHKSKCQPVKVEGVCLLLLVPLSCGRCLTDCVSLKCSILLSLLNKIAFWQHQCSEPPLLVYSFPLLPSPTFPHRDSNADGCCRRRCRCLRAHAQINCAVARVPPHTSLLHRDVQTPVGNPCLSAPSVLWVFLCFCSHCDSVWRKLLQCGSHPNAPQTHCSCMKSHSKGSPLWEIWQQAPTSARVSLW